MHPTATHALDLTQGQGKKGAPSRAGGFELCLSTYQGMSNVKLCPEELWGGNTSDLTKHPRIPLEPGPHQERHYKLLHVQHIQTPPLKW